MPNFFAFCRGQSVIGRGGFPVTVLEFSFHGFTSEPVDDFMGRFDLASRRGGG
jgi:hypothetical protein